MSGEGNRGDDLAPVIPLFGRRAGSSPGGSEESSLAPQGGGDVGSPPHRDYLAPLDDSPRPAAAAWNDTWGTDAERFRGPSSSAGVEPDIDSSSEIDLAEKRLLRRLRTRSLSVREARAVLAEATIPSEATEAILARLGELGYLDDAALAEHLVHIAVDRKGQGRQAIARTLAQRGVPRDVADAVIADLPDDDAERALEFARTKARSMRNLDHDTAVRRLSGQLARRGYGGAMAMDVARRALAENDVPTSGVRFR